MGCARHVLIVDNDAEMRYAVAGYLDLHEIIVTPVANGDAMWTALKHQRGTAVAMSSPFAKTP